MHVLWAETKASIQEKSTLFEQFFEPHLDQLEQYFNIHKDEVAGISEIPQYLQVCRWPFRKLEYSFALDALLDNLKSGDSFLDAGSGVTPLSHILANKGVVAEACDGNKGLIQKLKELHPEKIYGSQVNYSYQDLTLLSYPDSSFNAISCISVLEHIPAPSDQVAIKELIRVLKPGGILVLTVDYTPTQENSDSYRLIYYLKRLFTLIKKGKLKEITGGVSRKLQARQIVKDGLARQPRSANQCFEASHLEQDILPILLDSCEEVKSRLTFPKDLYALSPNDSYQFWNLEKELFNNQGQRAVLPAAIILQKILVPSLSL
ncbi:class I SAM-dependent methyltransferase [Candidatus Chlorohelix sp.]|uniref:class I SAM-dependent methyltransferase n=1 Tax=Candidatus Chlorohelix sp. TaxID=3139201 RepID=UPI003021FCD8